jgi:rubrerythrin
MRDNEDKIGTKKPDASPPPQAFEDSGASSTGLTFVVPTEFVALPSGGKYYPEGHPLYTQDTVEIKMMTTKQEDILTSRALLKKGVAIDRFIQSILVSKGITPDSLLVGDKNAILVAARISGYGAEYKTQVQCPVCQERSTFEFDLSEYAALEVGEVSDIEGVSATGNPQAPFDVSLPKTGWTVGCKMLFGEDEKKLQKSMDARKKAGLQENTLTDQLRVMIHSVEGHSDFKTVNEAISNMPAKDSKYLRDTYKKLVPNIDMTQEFLCTHCAYEGDMEVPLTADFFWPKS